MESVEARRTIIQWQGCTLATVGILLACVLLVIGPTGYAFYRYRTAQIFSGNIMASGQPIKLPTQGADTYTLTLQPQVSTPGGIVLTFAVRDPFGRTLSADTNFYTTGCPSGGPANQTCPAQSRDFQFTNRLGGPVQLTLATSQQNVEVTVTVRDESLGGIFASGSPLLFGAFFGCGTLLWLVSAVLIIVFALRLERRTSVQKQRNIQIQRTSGADLQNSSDLPGAQGDEQDRPSEDSA